MAWKKSRRRCGCGGEEGIEDEEVKLGMGCDVKTAMAANISRGKATGLSMWTDVLARTRSGAPAQADQWRDEDCKGRSLDLELCARAVTWARGLQNSYICIQSQLNGWLSIQHIVTVGERGRDSIPQTESDERFQDHSLTHSLIHSLTHVSAKTRPLERTSASSFVSPDLAPIGLARNFGRSAGNFLAAHSSPVPYCTVPYDHT